MDAVYPELYAGKVTVVTRDGRRITKRIDYSKGMPENPMSEEEVKSKFTSLAGCALGAAQAQQVLAELDDVFAASSVAPLAELLGCCQVQG